MLVLAVDLSKAFDCVDHQALAHIWQKLGMSSSTISMLYRATMQQDRRWCVASRFLGDTYFVQEFSERGLQLRVSGSLS